MTATMSERVVTSQSEAAQARQVLAALEGPSGTLAVDRDGERALELPPEVGRIVQRILSVMAAGGTVTLTALPAELTTTTAAALLGVSRPTLMKMIHSGELPVHKVGSHHRLRRADVEEARRSKRMRERVAMLELLDLEGDEI